MATVAVAMVAVVRAMVVGASEGAVMVMVGVAKG